MEPPSAQDRADLTVVPLRHPGRWVAAALLAGLAALLVYVVFFSTTIRNGTRQPRFQWNVVWQYLFTTPVLRGVVVTIELTVIAMAIGIVLGVVLALMRLSPNPVLTTVSWVYIWFFRGTPVLVQLVFWYNIAYSFPSITFGIPHLFTLGSINLNTALTPFLVGMLGLGLNEGAYMAEIVRAGIISVDEGQVEAAQSVGMRRIQAMRLVVLPQAMRLIIPPTGNEVISMLKTSSLASVVTVTELLKSVGDIYSRTYQTIPLLIVASLWYLAMTSVLTVGQYFVERHYARGAARPRIPWLWRKLGENLRYTRPPSTGSPVASVPRRGGGAPGSDPPPTGEPHS